MANPKFTIVEILTALCIMVGILFWGFVVYHFVAKFW